MSHSLYVGYLLDRDDHEFSRFERCETNLDVHYPEVPIVGGCRLAVALDEERFVGSAALKRALPEKTYHECIEIHSDLCPERFVVRLEDDPFRSAVKRLFEEESKPSDRDVLPL